MAEIHEEHVRSVSEIQKFEMVLPSEYPDQCQEHEDRKQDADHKGRPEERGCDDWRKVFHFRRVLPVLRARIHIPGVGYKWRRERGIALQSVETGLSGIL